MATGVEWANRELGGEVDAAVIAGQRIRKHVNPACSIRNSSHRFGTEEVNPERRAL